MGTDQQCTKSSNECSCFTIAAVLYHASSKTGVKADLARREAELEAKKKAFGMWIPKQRVEGPDTELMAVTFLQISKTNNDPGLSCACSVPFRPTWLVAISCYSFVLLLYLLINIDERATLVTIFGSSSVSLIRNEPPRSGRRSRPIIRPQEYLDCSSLRDRDYHVRQEGYTGQ